VWADEVETLIPSAEALEQRMMAYVWSTRHDELAVLEAEEKAEDGWIDEDAEMERKLRDEEDMKNAESGALPGSWEMREKRPVMLYAPLISGLAMMLTFLFIGSGMRESRSGTVHVITPQGLELTPQAS
jgi:hypothetical protein